MTIILAEDQNESGSALNPRGAVMPRLTLFKKDFIYGGVQFARCNVIFVIYFRNSFFLLGCHYFDHIKQKILSIFLLRK